MLGNLAHWAQKDPGKVAVFFPGQVITYQQFHARVCRLAAQLSGLNFRKTGIAAVYGDTLLDDWLLTGALRALGLDTICPKSLEQLREMSLRPLSVIVMGEDTARTTKVPHEYFTTPRVLATPAMLAGNAGAPSFTSYAAPCGGHMLITTGTTGTPKAVFYAGDQEDKRNEARAISFGFTRETVYYASNFPLYTAVGYKNPAATWHRGGSVVIDPLPLDAQLKLPDTVSSTVFTPATIEAFARSPRVVERVRKTALIRLSGGFLSANAWERLRKKFGRPLEVYFASTEIIGIMARSSVTNLDELTWLRPEPGRVLEIVAEDGTPCPPGVEGQLRVGLTDIDASSYVGDAAASARAFRDGYFYPGDMAVARPGGRIRILGRLNDVINVQGYKLAVAPIEHAVQAAVAADEVCVFSGRNDAGVNEVVVACLRPESLSGTELAAVEKVVSDLGPARVVQMAEFPLSPGAMRKTDRKALRKLLFPAS